ncbi:helix-turn-helix domain-containing protein [Kaistella sp.]|uniref:helix-turn-helix domain-containing protein n=1 Tax=Kaistella sp. TaxID=2782235 RepID=UPI003C4B2892
MDHLIQLNNFNSCKHQVMHDMDESLVSLRFLKEIDDYLEYKNLTNRDLANALGFSESYISQLMTGVKKINISFINKFEKNFNLEFDIKIKDCTKNNFFRFNTANTVYEINILVNTNISSSNFFQHKFYNENFMDVDDAIINE